MKKIAFIAPHISGKGGTETVLRTVVQLMIKKKAGYEPYIFVLGGSLDKAWLQGLPYQESHFSRNIILRNMIYFFSLLRYIHNERPDMIISLDPMICLLVNVVRKLTRGKYPIVSWIHFSLKSSKVRTGLVPKADYHLAISSGIARQLRELYIPQERIFTIYNPLKPSEQIIPRPTSNTIFLYAGRIEFEGQKRLKDLLESLSRLNGDWILEVYGDGQDLPLCQRYADQLHINDKIKWHGYVADPWDQMKEVTALILTSAYEGLPMVLAEAISRGVYCISSDCETGPRDLIQEGKNGRLYKSGHLNDLQKLLQNLINHKELPDPVEIQKSIKKFYVGHYYTNFYNALSRIDYQWNN
ncbi:lipopolysaccharide 1,6-galactosyltransferase [Sporolactobacillus sp. THM19-2]|uniref:lipopolysaccharide 1,6-galactosyltransferase n=1 Tax=Sporolactobacillus sp. THM19-2 TaxID=2511171 RepID=UPI00101F2A46|nr:lipopolysaccharide 1,6-galactosyltransferase [Sporolactobacillus sp. THM19-2]RYL93957.1 lipopolysaccharide 1,6-galactosyltransferase [Sporolactobacillus sp. THM19-2]